MSFPISREHWTEKYIRIAFTLRRVEIGSSEGVNLIELATERVQRSVPPLTVFMPGTVNVIGAEDQQAAPAGTLHTRVRLML